MLFFPTRSSFNSFLTRLSLIAGDLGDHSESEDDEEGEAEKTRWEGIFFSLLHHFTSGARKIFFIIFSYHSYFRWKEVQDVEKRVKMEQEMIHQANPALLPDSHSDL